MASKAQGWKQHLGNALFEQARNLFIYLILICLETAFGE